MNAWYYSDSSQIYGPITHEQLIAMIQAGHVLPQHHIMAHGARDWQLVASSPFSGYLPSTEMATRTRPAPAVEPSSPMPARPRPQGPAPKPSAPAKSSGGMGRIVIFAILMAAVTAGGYFFFVPPRPPARPQSSASTMATTAVHPAASERKAAPASPPSKQEGKTSAERRTHTAPQALTQSERQGRLVIPFMQFTDGTLLQAVEFLRQKAAEMDPLQQPVRISIDPRLKAGDARLNMDAADITLSAALEHIGRFYGADVDVSQDSFTLRRD
ncbi:MAG: GYF domain-containing protein [Prosthecobacter sp.]